MAGSSRAIPASLSTKCHVSSHDACFAGVSEIEKALGPVEVLVSGACYLTGRINSQPTSILAGPLHTESASIGRPRVSPGGGRRAYKGFRPARAYKGFRPALRRDWVRQLRP